MLESSFLKPLQNRRCWVSCCWVVALSLIVLPSQAQKLCVAGSRPLRQTRTTWAARLPFLEVGLAFSDGARSIETALLDYNHMYTILYSWYSILADRQAQTRGCSPQMIMEAEPDNAHSLSLALILHNSL